jgi:DMSO/TMAO reductase YedYZ molybdopterin-dependent catalytic subunit
MNNDEKTNPQKPKDTPATHIVPGQELAAAPVVIREAAESGTDDTAVTAEQEIAESTEATPEDVKSSDTTAIEARVVIEAAELQVDADASCSPSAGSAPQTKELAPTATAKPVLVSGHRSFFEEQPLPIIDMAPRVMRYRTRRDVLAFGIGAAAAITGAGYLLPKDTLSRLGVRRDMSSRGKEWFLNNALRIDDDVAEALYSQNLMVPTYTREQITPIKNNYNGATPEPWYISGWKLTLDGLASGVSLSLNIQTLMNRFSIHDQITRFVCVEGWSAIAWWAGLRFDDLLRAYPPQSQAKWARVESSVNLDNSGNPDPYFVSIDLATARHPQTLLATHHDGQPLTVEHGAPLRLLVPVKLGLKNVKAITRITYSAEEPKDYWTPFGYSSYDGI